MTIFLPGAYEKKTLLAEHLDHKMKNVRQSGLLQYFDPTLIIMKIVLQSGAG